MTKSIGEGNGSLNKQEFDDVPDAFFDEVFNYESQLTQGYVEQVHNIGTIGTVEVPVELAGNVINEEGNEEENGEEESTESDTDIDGRRRRLEFEDSADESNKEIYETDNDAALDDNNEFDVNLQSNFGRVGNTYLPKDFVVAAFEEDSDTNSKKGLDSPYYSSDEEGGRKRKFPEFCMSDLNNPKFEKGMLFGSKEVLKKAVKNYAVQGNYYVKFVKNDKRRITAQCKNCTWKLHASFMQLEQTLQIKTFIDKHICHRNPTNPYVKCVFIAHKYLDRIMDEPDIKCKHLRKAVKRDLGYNVSNSQCARAKNKAKEIIEGTYKEQYSRLREPIIGVDGCHLKGPFSVQLLAAVGVDANDNTYPIAYATVELETKETWSWFLEFLIDDLGPGLDRAFDIVVPQAQHRWCTAYDWLMSKDLDKWARHRRHPEDFVTTCYHKDTYLKAYEPIIHPVKGFHMWPRSNKTPLSPPLVRKQPGRPRRSRKKDHEMEKTADAIGANLRRKGTVTCTRCFQKGHNKRNCKNQPQDPPSGTYIDKRWTTGYPSKKKKGSGSQTSALVSEMNARDPEKLITCIYLCLCESICFCLCESICICLYECFYASNSKARSKTVGS
ncbi:hypothetical protein CerSpe_282750 [Prunus speciosa]